MEENENNGEHNDLKEYMLKEIDLIQDIIRRMASNSFLLKGWTITLVVATLLLRNNNNSKVTVAYIPLIIFWYLDSYYLQKERMYRELYNWVIKNRLKTDEYLLDMRVHRFSSKMDSIPQVMFSRTMLSFYGSIFLLINYFYYLFTHK